MPDEIESSGNCVPMQSKARERELKKRDGNSSTVSARARMTSRVMGIVLFIYVMYIY